MFGKYAIVAPVEYHFKEEPDLFWKIKAATAGDELELEKYLFANRRYVKDADGKSVVLPPLWVQQMHMEISLTFAGTNIAENDKLFIEDNASVETICKAILKMPEGMVEEIWLAVKETNPTWGPQFVQRKNDSAPNSTTQE